MKPYLRNANMEKTGKTIKSHLMKSDPFKRKTCADETCPVCSSNTRINCKTRDVVCELRCIYSDDDYTGENLWRVNSYTLGYTHSDWNDSVFHNHFTEKHTGKMSSRRYAPPVLEIEVMDGLYKRPREFRLASVFHRQVHLIHQASIISSIFILFLIDS